MPYFDPTTECLPREELRALQQRRLRGLLAELWDKNAFYSAKLRAAGLRPGDAAHLSLDDLGCLPLTTKVELVDDQAAQPPFGTNLTYPLSAYTRCHQTSGTTGQPLRVLDTTESWDWWGRCWGHVFAGAGLSASDWLFLAFSFGPFIGFWAAVEGARKIGAAFIPGGGRDSLQRLQLMRDLGATALCCTPTYALRLAEVAREAHFDLTDLRIRATVHAGEPGANVPATKQRIEDAWNAKCFDHAGASEVGAHSFECQAQPGGLHAIESEFIIEVVDPAGGGPVPPGERGELVITNLGRAGFPVIRYRTGDVVCLDPRPCACGRTLVRFDGGIVGRADDMVTVRGINVFPSMIENIVRGYKEVDEFRVTLHTVRHMDEMAVELEVTDGAEPGLADRVAETIRSLLSIRASVKVVPHGALPRFELKARRFHDERVVAR
jgi:phenylacetate-CoA ligase